MTKFHLFGESRLRCDPKKLLGTVIETTVSIRHACCYKFPLVMPEDAVVECNTHKEVVSRWFGGYKEVEEKMYHYYLLFGKELSEEEVNFWRMFKIGWRAQKVCNGSSKR